MIKYITNLVLYYLQNEIVLFFFLSFFIKNKNATGINENIIFNSVVEVIAIIIKE